MIISGVTTPLKYLVAIFSSSNSSEVIIPSTAQIVNIFVNKVSERKFIVNAVNEK